MKEMAIVAALQGGNLRRGLELLLDAYQEDLFTYCGRLVGPADVLRVYDQILLATADNVGALPATASIRAWLYQLARHAITHQHRKERREGALDPDYAPVDGPAPLMGPLRGDDLEGVDAPVREILQLALWHGLRLEEVAQVVGRPLASVRQLAAAGLARVAAGQRRGEELPS